MALLVPNASDTTSGNKYEALDQAEPDSLDFEILGTRGSGVLSGCAVTSNSSSSNVAVASGVIVVSGIPYAVSANASLALPSSPADNRFDLVVARVSGGSASLVVVQGDNSSTNPSFPKSTSVLTGASSPTANVNFDTDVVLAALYRSGSNTVTSSRIVDKRVFLTNSVFDQGTAAPSSGYGNGTGSLYYQTNASAPTDSGVYVKSSTGDWVRLAKDVGYHLPIGAAVLWPSVQSVPTGCLEANGQAVSTSAYPDLFAAYGYTHGGSGGTFNLPNYNNRFIRGTTSTGLVGTTVGSDSVVLTESNLPAHTHTLSHTHTFAHTHGIDHTHAGSTTTGTGEHDHSVEFGGYAQTGAEDYYNFHIWAYLDAGGPFGLPTPPADTVSVAVPIGEVYKGPSYYQAAALLSAYGDPNPYDNITRTRDVGSAGTVGGHSHGVPSTSFTGSTVSQSSSTTSAASSSTTSSVGSGASFSTIPASTYARYIIRAV